jgi:hypothetical protein
MLMGFAGDAVGMEKSAGAGFGFISRRICGGRHEWSDRSSSYFFANSSTSLFKRA